MKTTDEQIDQIKDILQEFNSLIRNILIDLDPTGLTEIQTAYQKLKKKVQMI